MIKVSAYRKVIKVLSVQDSELAPYLEGWMNKDHKLPWLALSYKKELLSQEERERSSCYLSFGFFNKMEEIERMACFSIGLEAEYIRDLNRQKKACTPYNGTEVIFENPSLRERRNKDLIEGMVGERGYASNIFRLGKKWGYYDSRIPL